MSLTFGNPPLSCSRSDLKEFRPAVRRSHQSPSFSPSRRRSGPSQPSANEIGQFSHVASEGHSSDDLLRLDLGPDLRRDDVAVERLCRHACALAASQPEGMISRVRERTGIEPRQPRPFHYGDDGLAPGPFPNASAPAIDTAIAIIDEPIRDPSSWRAAKASTPIAIGTS